MRSQVPFSKLDIKAIIADGQPAAAIEAEKAAEAARAATTTAAATTTTAAATTTTATTTTTTTSAPLTIPAGAAGNTVALKAAGDSVFNTNGGKRSRCAQYTYHIAYYYTQVALKGSTPSGQFIGPHGNANDKIYRDNLIKLGYKMTDLGVMTKQQLINYISQIKTVGTIINYRSTVGVGGNNYANIYGHTQIYTGGILNTSHQSKWASSFGYNYDSSFVYGSKPSNSWEAFLFTL
jgi:hypothetical protein